jgi:uncharacterized membrane protein
MDYLLLKTLHVLSSTVLFGTGIGTAFHMWMTHCRGDVRAIAVTARNVVLADFLFTTPSGVLQPATGLILVQLGGIDPASHWLLVTYAIYGVAGIAWLVVVVLQLRVAAIAAACVETGAALPDAYFRLMRAWFWLGWPAFIGLVFVFWLMVAKPDLW